MQETSREQIAKEGKSIFEKLMLEIEKIKSKLQVLSREPKEMDKVIANLKRELEEYRKGNKVSSLSTAILWHVKQKGKRSLDVDFCLFLIFLYVVN